MKFTKEELAAFVAEHRKIFDIVRLVEVSENIQYKVSDDGEITAQLYECYSIWKRGARCDNCISCKVTASKDRLTKFEFVDDDVYFVIAMYAEVEGKEYALELLLKIKDESLFGAYGKTPFILTMQEYNNRKYMDFLTGAFNRRYFEDQLRQLGGANGIMVLDIDKLKLINATHGYAAGDRLLNSLPDMVRSKIRSTDAIVRWGDDEFIILFQGITKRVFELKMESIREEVEKISIFDHPELKATVSIGGVFSERAGECLDEALKALTKAKEKGNCCVLIER